MDGWIRRGCNSRQSDQKLQVIRVVQWEGRQAAGDDRLNQVLGFDERRGQDVGGWLGESHWRLDVVYELALFGNHIGELFHPSLIAVYRAKHCHEKTARARCVSFSLSMNQLERRANGWIV